MSGITKYRANEIVINSLFSSQSLFPLGGGVFCLSYSQISVCGRGALCHKLARTWTIFQVMSPIQSPGLVNSVWSLPIVKSIPELFAASSTETLSPLLFSFSSVLQGRKNWEIYPDNEAIIIISHCQFNGLGKQKNRVFTMKIHEGCRGCGRSCFRGGRRHARCASYLPGASHPAAVSAFGKHVYHT